jgi:drug/metabolite transporter (DMT)-like permease
MRSRAAPNSEQQRVRPLDRVTAAGYILRGPAQVTHIRTPVLQRLRHDAAMLLVCLIWGANFSVTKLAFARLSPLAFTALRFLAGSALLFAVVRLVEGRGELPRGPLFWRLFWLGIVGNTLYQLGFVLGLARSTATNTSLIMSASPAAVAILGAALGLERTTARVRWGIALGMAGVAIVVLARAGASFGLRAGNGDLLTLVALACWSIYTLGLRGLEGLSPLRVTAWTTYAGTPGIVLAGIPDLLKVDWRGLGWGVWAALGYATALSLILGYLLWNRSVRAVGGTKTAIYMCVTPLVALLVAWAVLGERPTPLHPIGGALIAAGVLLTRLNPRAPPPPE